MIANNLVFIDQNIVDIDKKPIDLWFDQYLKIVEVILAPTLIFESNTKCLARYYYSASRHLQCPVIIGVSHRSGIWKVNEYFENPSVSLLLGLLKHHLQDGGITVFVDNEIEDNALETS